MYMYSSSTVKMEGKKGKHHAMLSNVVLCGFIRNWHYGVPAIVVDP